MAKEKKQMSWKTGCLIFVVAMLIIIILLICFGGNGTSDADDAGNEPDEIELMTYAQTVLDDYYPSAKYPSSRDDYNCVGSYLRYKIEGNVSVDGLQAYQPFYIIIEFTDDTYTEYTLISLQIGDDMIYEQ